MLPESEMRASNLSEIFAFMRPDPLTVNLPNSFFNFYTLIEPKPEITASKLEATPFNSMRPDPDNTASRL